MGAKLSWEFNLEKKDDVRQFVVRREAGKKKKAPKIQRLVTPATLQRKRHFRNQTRKKMVLAKKLKADYTKRVSEYRQQQKELRAAEVAKKKKDKQSSDEEVQDAGAWSPSGKTNPICMPRNCVTQAVEEIPKELKSE